MADKSNQKTSTDRSDRVSPYVATRTAYKSSRRHRRGKVAVIAVAVVLVLLSVAAIVLFMR